MQSKSSLDAVINRKRLQANETALVSILRDLPDAVLLIDSGGGIFYANERAKKLFALHNTSDVSAILPKSSKLGRKSARLAHWQKINRLEKVEDFETQLLDSGGKTIFANTSHTAIRDRNGKLVGITAVVKDITQTRETEQRITRRNAQLFALIDVAEAITSVSKVETLLTRVLDAVLRVTSLEAGCVHLFNEDEDCLNLIVEQNINAKVTEMLRRFELGEGVIGQTAVLAETLLVSDTTADRRLARPVSTEQIGALAAVPLTGRAGTVRGVMTLFNSAPRRFTEHEASMLTAIGKQVGVALERTELLQIVTSARREWEQTFDSMTDGVSIHAPSGKIRRANDSLAEMFSTTPDKLVGIRCCELYHGSKKPRPDCTIMRTVTERMAQRVELTDRLHGRILRVITDPIIGEAGRILGVVCTTRDVTDEKLIERRLIQQERISAIGEIAAGIAHEVGTPLNIISANVEFLLRNGEAEELGAIREQTANITKLVRQLLDFSHDHSPTFAPVNINDLIERTLGLLNHQLPRVNISCETSLARYLPTVDGDGAQLQQVLFNLITNAWQAMENTNGKRILRVVTDSALMPTETFNRPHIVITIADTGRGIPDEALSSVFNPFFTANKEGGTGLGLAISYRIVQKHLGTLTLQNNPRGGAIAQIRLPLSQEIIGGER
jgi:two-component system, NtrC family, sensor kinase